jgi:prepilin-type N-terminal cleavage/methylation domain-containing protein
VDDRRAPGDRGFTLIEIVIAVAIIATVVAAGVAVSLGARSFAVSTAAAEFDHLLDSARTIARETQGATLVFAPDAYGDGTEVRVLTSGPNGTLVATTMPIVRTRAAIEEATLGTTPFAFVVHASGSLGGRPGYRLGDSTASGEVGCPAAGTFHFVIRAAGATADRLIPCRINLAATGPLTIPTWPPAVIAPPPTPCGGPCQPGTLPTPPSSSPTCPPNFTATPGGCAPSPAPGAPQYHVSASLASATMPVGGSTSLTAQATLTNPAAVAPGTPTSIPVLVQQTSNTVCTATPPGAQPSGAQFALNAIASGTCTATIGADASGVPGATADTTSLTVTVTAAPSATPSPQACDLIENGKCYHRIVDRTSQTFWKHVVPDDNCAVVPGGSPCMFLDSIKQIFLEPGFGIQPPVPPTDSAHEILIKIDSIVTVLTACLPYTVFAADNPAIPIFWGGQAIGAPTNPDDGLGEPSIFTTGNRIIEAWAPTGNFTLGNTWSQPTTLSEMSSALAFRRVGLPFSLTYSASDITPGAYVQLHPDFPGCDAAGDPNAPGVEYGNAGVALVLEVYQAVP